MISVRSLRSPSPSTAALVRFAAFLVAVAAAVTIVVELGAAVTGHTGVATAFGWAAFAAALTLVAALAARSLDPMRR